MTLIKSQTAKLAAGLVGVAMIASAVLPSLASAQSATDLQNQINLLLSQISSLQGQLGGSSSTSGTGYQFNTNLTMGSKGTDVMNLQKVLNMDPATRVNSTANGAGSPGRETSTFGGLTRAAVIKFQIKNGISPAAGYVGPITRAKLNAMGGVVVVPPGTPAPLPTGGALSVYAGAQPANQLAPKGASRVPFTNFTVTAGSSDVTINSVTVGTSGSIDSAAFAGVVLLDSATGLQIGNSKTLNSNDQATIGEPFVVRAGTSKMLTVAGNMASSLSSYAGQIGGLNVVAVNSSASVAGSFPIMGAQNTAINNLTIGTVTISTSSFDPNNAGSQPIGTTGFKFTGFKVTAGSGEDVTLKSVRWNQIGTVSAADLANVTTVINGTSYPTTVSADGKYYTTVIPSGVVIAKGNSIELYVQGDVVGSGAAGRYAEFDIAKNTDLYLTGNTYNYGIVAPLGSGVPESDSSHGTTLSGTGTPWLEGSTLSITAGSVTLIGKANEVAAQNVAVNVANQVLGGFATNFTGEPISVQSMYFSISTTSGSLPTTANSPYSALTNVSIVDENGVTVASGVDAELADGSTAHGNVISAATSYAWLHFTDTITFPTGRHVYTIKGKVPSAWSNGTVITLYTKPSTDWTSVTGQTTGNTISLSGQSTAFSLNTMTVKSGALTVSVSSQPTTQTIVAGGQNVTLANYVLDATASGEDVRISAFPVNITDSSISDLSGCQIYNGSTALNTGANVVNGSTMTTATSKTFSFDNSLVITKGSSVTLTLKCNIATGATASISVNATAITAGQLTVTGQVSGNSITPTVNSTAGAVFSLSSGSLAISVDSSSPATTTVAGGVNGVTLGVVKFRSSNEPVSLTKVGLVFTQGTSANVGQVYLFNGSQQVGTISTIPATAGTTATSTLSTPVLLPINTDVKLTIKADINPIGSGQSGVPGAPVIVDVTNAEGTGQSSGSVVTRGGATIGTAGVRTFRSTPTVGTDNGTLGTTGVLDGKLMRFKVTAGTQGDIGIYNLSFTLATSGTAGGGVTSAKLFAFSDASYSSPLGTTMSSNGAGQVGATNGDLNGTNATLLTSNPTIRFSATTNPVPVPAGGSVYFELRGTTATGGATFAVTSTLLGDSAYITSAHLPNSSTFVSTTTGVTADTNNKFVWSDNATSTATIAGGAVDLDWANGANVMNLPSSGLSFTRSL